MQHELTAAIQTRKWTWKPSSLQTMGVIDEDEPVTFKADGIWYRSEKVTEHTCLGTKLDTKASILHERSIAENAMWGSERHCSKRPILGLSCKHETYS